MVLQWWSPSSSVCASCIDGVAAVLSVVECCCVDVALVRVMALLAGVGLVEPMGPAIFPVGEWFSSVALGGGILFLTFFVTWNFFRCIPNVGDCRIL